MRTLYILIAFILIHCGNSLSQKDKTSDTSLAQQTEELNLPPGTPVFTFEQIKTMPDLELSNTLKQIRREVILEDKPMPYFKYLENWKLHELSDDKLDSIFYYIVVFGYLDQITSRQIQDIGPKGINNVNFIIKCLNPQQTKDLTPEQIASRYVVYDLTAPQIAEFNAEQINAIGGEGFTIEKTKTISPDIISQLDYLSIPFSRLTKAQVEAVTPEQLSFDGFFQEGINNFLPHQIPWLTPEQISAHPLKDEEGGPIYPIKPELLSAMSLEQTKAIPPEMSYEFEKKYLYALSLEQLYHFKENPKVSKFIHFAEQARQLLEETDPADYQIYSQEYVLSMMPEEFQHITERQARGFPHNWITLLTPSRIKHFRHYAKLLHPKLLESNNHYDPAFLTHPMTKEQFQAIPPEQMPDLSLEFLKVIEDERVYWFTFDQLTYLSKEQLTMLFATRFSDPPNTNDSSVLSIMYIAEQAGKKGDEWLRGPMREAVVEQKIKECERSDKYNYYNCEDGVNMKSGLSERFKQLSRYDGYETWMKFPDMPEYMKERYLTPPHDQPSPIIDRGPGYLFGCDLLSNYISDRKKALANSKKD